MVRVRSLHPNFVKTNSRKRSHEKKPNWNRMRKPQPKSFEKTKTLTTVRDTDMSKDIGGSKKTVWFVKMTNIEFKTARERKIKHRHHQNPKFQQRHMRRKYFFHSKKA